MDTAEVHHERVQSKIFNLGMLYFALVFTVGWVLGPLREFWLIPRFGRTTGHLVEAPVMILASFVAARLVIRKAGTPAFLVRAAIGLTAFSLLLAAELLGIWLVRGLSLAQFLASFNPVTATVTFVAYGLFALMPVLIGCSSGPHP